MNLADLFRATRQRLDDAGDGYICHTIEKIAGDAGPLYCEAMTIIAQGLNTCVDDVDAVSLGGWLRRTVGEGALKFNTCTGFDEAVHMARLAWLDKLIANEDCTAGLHSWVNETGTLPAHTACANCGELYGDPG